ncbi:MAG: 2-phospho-L-lactate transferase [Alteromonadaceae bacterium]|nr:2-phospho-L-lactate transferase [Alteromonadaceae bacterium]
MGAGPGTTCDAPLVLLSGGGGGARLAAGLSQTSAERPLLVVTNTGDDFEHCGLSICPDTDSVLYAVSATIDPQRGWGRAEESWSVFNALKSLGGPDWFKLGDKDLALHLSRAAMLAAGQDLAGVATALGERLGVPPHVAVVPATESPVRTHVVSEHGKMAFQEYFVAHRCTPVLRNVVYEGIDSASPADRLCDALEVVGVAGTDVVLGPSNPFLSLAPILGIPGMQGLLRRAARHVVAVSPIIGGRALKGPAGKIMSELGLEVSSAGWTRWMNEQYPGLVDVWVWDETDQAAAGNLRSESMDVRTTSTVMSDPGRARALGDWLLGVCNSDY